MGKQNIEKFSLIYSTLKIAVKLWQNNIHYRRIIVIGRDNISRDDYNIFAPTHQNSVMDSLGVIGTSVGQPIFLARSDVFRKGIIARLLYSFKILPVYRIRDGFDTLSQNDEIFKKTIDAILNKSGLAIHPEGEHSRYRRLRQLKKGICRIAFQAEESQNFNLGIKIVPVGLEYTHYQRFREVLTVVYGKPFGISEFFDVYKKSPQIAFNQLRDKISENMKPLMIHIESQEDYEALNELREIVNGKFSDDRKNPKFFKDKKLIADMEDLSANNPELYTDICNKSLKIKHLAYGLRVGYRQLCRRKPGLISCLITVLALLVSFPLFIFGFIFNYAFIKIPALPLSKIKDIMFHSTVRFVLSLALAIVLIPLYAILSFILIPVWWISLLTFLSIIPAGLFAWNYFLTWQKIREGLRVRRYYIRKNPEFRVLLGTYRELMSDLNKTQK